MGRSVGFAARSNPVRQAASHTLSLVREEVTTVLIDQLESASATAGDTGQRLVGDMHMQAGFF